MLIVDLISFAFLALLLLGIAIGWRFLFGRSLRKSVIRFLDELSPAGCYVVAALLFALWLATSGAQLWWVLRYPLLLAIPLLLVWPAVRSREVARRRGTLLALTIGVVICVAYAPFDTYQSLSHRKTYTCWTTHKHWTGRPTWEFIFDNAGHSEGPLDQDGDRHGRWESTHGFEEAVQYYHHGEKVSKSRWYELEST